MLPRIVGFVLVASALALLVAPRMIAAWLGRPIGWGSLWESFRGTGPAGDTVYKGYKAYTFVAGWFWFLMLELILLGFGLYLVVTGS